MTGLDGQWGSRRKRRKLVDAALFGDGLPKGWRLLLAMKRKDGIVYLNCRRYVSPAGKQFMSCKEVSSYILSLNGQRDDGEPVSSHHDECVPRVDKSTLGSGADLTYQDGERKDVASSPLIALISYASEECQKQGQVTRVQKQAESQPYSSIQCKKCNMSFSSEDEHLQHLSTFHPRSAKRRKLGQSITDGVIVKDGKYECQFCHKTFTERHRYNGHMGAHIRYEGLGVDASPHNTDTSSLAVVPHVQSELDLLVNISGEANNDKPVDNHEQNGSPQFIVEEDLNECKHNLKRGQPEIAVAISTECKREIEHNSSATASEINEAVSSNSMKEFEHNPLASAPEISGLVDNNKIADNRVEDCKSTCNESEEIMQATYATNVTYNGNTSAVSPSGTDMNNKSHALLPHEPSPSEPVHDQNCEMLGAMFGFNEDIDIRDGKCNGSQDALASNIAVDAATCKSIGETGHLFSKSTIASRNISDDLMDSYNSERNADTTVEMSFDIAAEFGDFSSKDNLVGRQVNNSDVADYKSEAVYATNAPPIEAHECSDALSPSLINVDNMTFDNSNIIDPSCTLVSTVENCNGDQKVCEEYRLLSLSSDPQNYGVEPCGAGVFTSNVREDVDFDVPVQEKGPIGSLQALTNQDTGVARTMPNELNTSYVFTNISSEPTSGIDTNADCMFSGDLNKSLLEGMDRVGDEFQNYFHRSHICNDNDADAIMGNNDGRQTWQVNVDDQSSSRVQSSESLPILDLISDQCRDELRDAVPSNEQANVSGFEELRLGSVEPVDFVLFSGQASGSVTRSPMELFPEDQLGWGISSPKMGNSSVPTSVCVWCSREFSLEGVETEPQSETLGYICPDCKAKISGQFGLLNSGFS